MKIFIFSLVLMAGTISVATALTNGASPEASIKVSIASVRVEIVKSISRKETLVIDSKEYNVTQPSNLILFKDTPDTFSTSVLKSALESDEEGRQPKVNPINEFVEKTKKELCSRSYEGFQTLGSATDLMQAEMVTDKGEKLPQMPIPGLELLERRMYPTRIRFSFQMDDGPSRKVLLPCKDDEQQ